MALAVLGAFSTLVSEMPRPVAAMMAIASMAHGARQAWRESRRTPRMLVWPVDGAPHLDDVELLDVRLHWRGPLAFLQWRNDEGVIERLSWWSDTLAPRERRDLRLAAAGANGAHQPSTMAP